MIPIQVLDVTSGIDLAIKSSFSSRIDSDIVHASRRESRRRIDASLVGEDVRHNAEAVGGRPDERKEDNGCYDHDDCN